MGAACRGYCRKIYLAIDNVLYAINETMVMWKKELKSLVKGNPTIFNDKLAISTLDDCLYMLDMRMIVQSGPIISHVIMIVTK
ncbi:hypothetical protein [Wolbachia endosymbiont of Brugia pahangi]|uniref:hypothetical protein n=1 Tax=Wolbachia endosymbiont of Brugia pahangi TaxID=96495 RepID=UPI001435E233|nr:hypothetical protein [Wolbachia endosymbiont of Brugia pahangi]QIT36563.1 pQQ enzyme repeat family protein [Wolbachia endosymbiont of Brugia pahangi]